MSLVLSGHPDHSRLAAVSVRDTPPLFDISALERINLRKLGFGVQLSCREGFGVGLFVGSHCLEQSGKLWIIRGADRKSEIQLNTFLNSPAGRRQYGAMIAQNSYMARRQPKTEKLEQSNKSSKAIRSKPTRDKHLPAPKDYVWEIGESLRFSFTSRLLEIRSSLAALDTKVDKIRGRVDSMVTRLEVIENKFDMANSETREFQSKVDEMFVALGSRMDFKSATIDEKFSALDCKFISIETQLAKIDSTLHNMLALYEEQNARNKFVLDGYAQIYERQKVLDKGMGSFDREK